MKPILGRDYWPSPTLRQMPRGWILEETRLEQRYRWWKDPDFWLSVAGFVFIVALVAQAWAAPR